MDSRTALKLSLSTADMVALGYLSDLTDADLMLRPHPGCNHLNWQVGHLIISEHRMLEQAFPGKMPPLPSGFAEKYAKETAGSNDPSAFATKDALLKAFQEQRAATLKILEGLSDADLDKDTGIPYAPTAGAVLSLQGSHWLMHAGQWVIVRRQLGKPAMF